jgi:hypothetical protein
MGFGQFGAEGIEGGRALARSLDERTFDYDVGWWRSEEERLRRAVRYLTRKTGGSAALHAHGVQEDAGTLAAWLEEPAVPDADQRQRLEKAFRDLRRRNITPSVIRQLNARGGTRIEITPVAQEGVQDRHRRQLRLRVKNIYRWDDIVRAWAQQDSLQMEHLWADIIGDLDSDYRKYEYVSYIGICG